MNCRTFVVSFSHESTRMTPNGEWILEEREGDRTVYAWQCKNLDDVIEKIREYHNVEWIMR